MPPIVDPPHAAPGAPDDPEGNSPMSETVQAYEPVQTHEHEEAASRPRHARTQRRPTRPLPAATVVRPIEGCPVAVLAAEAAAIRLLKLRLWDQSPQADQALIDKLQGSDDTITVSELTEECHERLEAITEMTSHRRAKSTKGALFQLYAVADRITSVDDVLSISCLPKHERDEFESWRNQVRRLVYSAAAQLEATAIDDDLRLLRKWMLPPEYDVSVALDQILRAPAASSLNR
jgi:hypothetical protein